MEGEVSFLLVNSFCASFKILINAIFPASNFLTLDAIFFNSFNNFCSFDLNFLLDAVGASAEEDSVVAAAPLLDCVLLLLLLLL